MAHDEVASIEQRPLPVATEVTEEFYALLRKGILSVQQCGSCGVWQIPSRDGGHFCDECGEARLSWTRVSGHGSVYSYTVMHQRYHSAFFAELPYNIAIIQLEEGPRLTSRLDMPLDKIKIDMPVRAIFKDVGSGVLLPYFVAANPSGPDDQ